MRKTPPRWPWVLVAAVVLAAAGWMLWPRHDAGAPGTAPAPTPSADPAARPAPDGTRAPAIAHPIDVDAADAAIPPLADSDAAAWEALSGLAGDPALLDVLLREHLVRRLVVMIDNLTEPRMPTRALAMRPLPGTLSTEGDGATRWIAQANAQRYEPYVAAFAQADPQRVAAAYRRFYPLFQQAYAEIAGGDAYFNDRLVAVIDHLLQAPEPAQPLQVVDGADGKVRFAAPARAALSGGETALVRLSPDQRERVKRQLRSLRGALAQG